MMFDLNAMAGWVFWGQQALLLVDNDPGLPRPGKSFLQQLKGFFTGGKGSVAAAESVFSTRYMVYWVEILVFVQIVLLTLYLARSLSLFKRGS